MSSKVILITGANTGIGIELARILAAKGHNVYIAARNETSGKEAVETLKKEGFSAKFVLLDVTDINTITAAKSTIEKAEGYLDVLVNNAGAAFLDKPQKATDIDVSVVRSACEVNLFGLIQTTTTLLPLLLLSKSTPTILNVTTDMASNAFQARPESQLHVVAYNTSKAAANSYTIALARELKGKAVVNTATPGFTTTKLNFFSEGGRTPKEAAEGLAVWALETDKDKTGLFIGYDGKEFPW